jgi:drug/metabolite transporter (DMT)-like permease
MYFATEAGINVGLITVIWSVNPLLMAIADRIIYKTHLKYYHYIGLLAIMICTIIIALFGGAKADIKVIELVENKEKCPSWIPILFGLFTPCMFCTNGMFTKKVFSPEVGFDASNCSFTAYGLVNVIVLFFAVPYWVNTSYNNELFWVGMFGSIINCIGLVCIQNALTMGPAGPVSAIAASSCILLVIIEAIKKGVMISLPELIGLIFGFYGALILVIPEKFECCWPCFAKIEPAKEESEKTPLNKEMN